ncbi:MAG: sporulation protein YunB [Bacilli bacterium]|nr:sporulation protein YunB [Bacilli bacterium]
MKRLKKISTIILYIIVIAIIISILIIKFFSSRIKPNFNRYIVSEVERIVILIINDSVNNELENVDVDNFFVVNNDSNSNSFNLNNKDLNEVQRRINKSIDNNIRLISSGKIREVDKYFNSMSDIDYETIKGGIVYYIISGNVSGNIFMNNLGPKIPIKFSMYGGTISNIVSDVKEYGINNAMIEIRINIKVNMIVNMPYISKKVVVKTSAPVATKIIQGSIPNYYLGSNMK